MSVFSGIGSLAGLGPGANINRAVSSLFGNSMSGDHLAAAGGAYEPQRMSSWKIQVGINSEAMKKIQLSLEASAAPSVAVEDIAMDFLNVKRYVAGKAQYDTIPLVVKDMVDVGVASAMRDWHRLVYDPATDRVGLARNYKSTAFLILTAPDGSYARLWALYGCWPVSVNFGTLDMTSSDVVRIEATLRYDKADSVF